jgi:hypothetical protein
MSRLRGIARVAVAFVVLWVPASAQGEGAPIRECGNAGRLYGGAIGIYNVTSRVVPCRPARRFARHYVRYGGPACAEDRYCTYRGWSCTNVGYRVGGDYEVDSRCVKGARVVRFQARGG